MCHQTVGLVQGKIENEGIVTAGITLLEKITRKVSPPRALAVPFPLGYPLGEPNERDQQRKILKALLSLCSRRGTPLIHPLDLDSE